MAKDDTKAAATPKAKMTAENFTFERAKGATLKTEVGIFSSRGSKTESGQSVPCRGYIVGDHWMVTEIDKERARVEAEKTGMDIEEAETNAKPGQYLRIDLTAPTIVVQNGNKKVQEDGMVLCFVNVQLKTLLDFAMDPKDIHEFEIFETAETKVSGGKRSMHNYELTHIGKITREEYLKRKGDLLSKAAVKTSGRQIAENGGGSSAEA